MIGAKVTEVRKRATKSLIPEEKFFKKSTKHVDQIVASIKLAEKYIKKVQVGLDIGFKKTHVNAINQPPDPSDKTFKIFERNLDSLRLELKRLLNWLLGIEHYLGEELNDFAGESDHTEFVMKAIKALKYLTNEKHRLIRKEYDLIKDVLYDHEEISSMEDSMMRLKKIFSSFIDELEEERDNLYIHKEELKFEIKKELSKYFHENKQIWKERIKNKLRAGIQSLNRKAKGHFSNDFFDELDEVDKLDVRQVKTRTTRLEFTIPSNQRTGKIYRSQGFDVTLNYLFNEDSFRIVYTYDDGYKMEKSHKVEPLLDKAVILRIKYLNSLMKPKTERSKRKAA